MSNVDSDYYRSRDSLPASSDTCLELAEYLDKLKQMQKDAKVELNRFYSPREIYTQPNDINTTELAN